MLAAPHAPIRNARAVLADTRQSSLSAYRELTIGGSGIASLVLFELASMFLLPFPGAAGLCLRRLLLGRYFGHMGRKVVIGRNCVFRHPRDIHLGEGVIIDDNCVLDARGCGEEGLRIGDHTFVNRGCVIQSKAGAIAIGARVSIGAGSHLVSWSGITIGDDVAIAGGCHLSAGTFPLRELARPAMSRTPVSNVPIRIESGVWLATGSVVLDGVQLGANAVVSAGSVVSHSVAAATVVQGNPAKPIFVIR